MQIKHFSASRHLRTDRLAAWWTILALGWWAMTWPGEALARTGQPLAYVTGSDGISVIDTGDNKVVDTIPASSSSVAVAADGKHIYIFGPSTSDFVFNISVIDVTSDSVVATIPLNVLLIQDAVSLNQKSGAIAVTPDGKHIYATTGVCPDDVFGCEPPERAFFALWEIDSVTNKVVAVSLPAEVDAPAGKGVSDGIAFTPDGQLTYLANFDPYNVLPQVIVAETANSISLPAYGDLYSIAITPDGKHAYLPYVVNNNLTTSEVVPILDTATNTVVKTVLVDPNAVGPSPSGVALTPDGKHLYVPNGGRNSVVVIDTANNTVVKTISVGTSPAGVAVTPDGKHVYVANQGSNTVSVIDTANNTVGATVSVTGPSAISIIPPPEGVPFLSFDARLDIKLGHQPNQAAFNLESEFILSSAAGNGFHPDTVPVKLQVGPFITTIPAGSFRERRKGSYTFDGVIDGVRLEARIELRGGFRYAFDARAKGVNLSGTTNPVQVSLGLGEGAGLTSVKAHFDRDHQACNFGSDHWR